MNGFEVFGRIIVALILLAIIWGLYEAIFQWLISKCSERVRRAEQREQAMLNAYNDMLLEIDQRKIPPNLDKMISRLMEIKRSYFTN